MIGGQLLWAKPNTTIPDSLQVLHFDVNGVSFHMQRVEGGVFIMGGTLKAGSLFLCHFLEQE